MDPSQVDTQVFNLTLEALHTETFEGRCTQWDTMPQPGHIVSFKTPAGQVFYGQIESLKKAADNPAHLDVVLKPLQGSPSLDVEAVQYLTQGDYFQSIHPLEHPQIPLVLNQFQFDLAEAGLRVGLDIHAPAIVSTLVNSLIDSQSSVIVLNQSGLILDHPSLHTLYLDEANGLCPHAVGATTVAEAIAELMPEPVRETALSVMLQALPKDESFFSLNSLTQHPILETNPLGPALIQEIRWLDQQQIFAKTPEDVIQFEAFDGALNIDFSRLVPAIHPLAYKLLLEWIGHCQPCSQAHVVMIHPSVYQSGLEVWEALLPQRLVLADADLTSFNAMLTDRIVADRCLGQSGITVYGQMTQQLRIFLPTSQSTTTDLTSVTTLPDENVEVLHQFIDHDGVVDLVFNDAISESIVDAPNEALIDLDDLMASALETASDVEAAQSINEVLEPDNMSTWLEDTMMAMPNSDTDVSNLIDFSDAMDLHESDVTHPTDLLEPLDPSAIPDSFPIAFAQSGGLIEEIVLPEELLVEQTAVTEPSPLLELDLEALSMDVAEVLDVETLMSGSDEFDLDLDGLQDFIENAFWSESDTVIELDEYDFIDPQEVDTTPVVAQDEAVLTIDWNDLVNAGVELGADQVLTIELPDQPADANLNIELSNSEVVVDVEATTEATIETSALIENPIDDVIVERVIDDEPALESTITSDHGVESSTETIDWVQNEGNSESTEESNALALEERNQKIIDEYNALINGEIESSPVQEELVEVTYGLDHSLKRDFQWDEPQADDLFSLMNVFDQSSGFNPSFDLNFESSAIDSDLGFSRLVEVDIPNILLGMSAIEPLEIHGSLAFEEELESLEAEGNIFGDLAPDLLESMDERTADMTIDELDLEARTELESTKQYEYQEGGLDGAAIEQTELKDDVFDLTQGMEDDWLDLDDDLSGSGQQWDLSTLESETMIEHEGFTSTQGSVPAETVTSSQGASMSIPMINIPDDTLSDNESLIASLQDDLMASYDGTDQQIDQIDLEVGTTFDEISVEDLSLDLDLSLEPEGDDTIAWDVSEPLAPSASSDEVADEVSFLESVDWSDITIDPDDLHQQTQLVEDLDESTLVEAFELDPATDELGSLISESIEDPTVEDVLNETTVDSINPVNDDTNDTQDDARQLEMADNTETLVEPGAAEQDEPFILDFQEAGLDTLLESTALPIEPSWTLDLIPVDEPTNTVEHSDPISETPTEVELDMTAATLTDPTSYIFAFEPDTVQTPSDAVIELNSISPAQLTPELDEDLLEVGESASLEATSSDLDQLESWFEELTVSQPDDTTDPLFDDLSLDDTPVFLEVSTQDLNTELELTIAAQQTEAWVQAQSSEAAHYPEDELPVAQPQAVLSGLSDETLSAVIDLDLNLDDIPGLPIVSEEKDPSWLAKPSLPVVDASQHDGLSDFDVLNTFFVDPSPAAVSAEPSLFDTSLDLTNPEPLVLDDTLNDYEEDVPLAEPALTEGYVPPEMNLAHLTDYLDELEVMLRQDEEGVSESETMFGSLELASDHAGDETAHAIETILYPGLVGLEQHQAKATDLSTPKVVLMEGLFLPIDSALHPVLQTLMTPKGLNPIVVQAFDPYPPNPVQTIIPTLAGYQPHYQSPAPTIPKVTLPPPVTSHSSYHISPSLLADILDESPLAIAVSVDTPKPAVSPVPVLTHSTPDISSPAAVSTPNLPYDDSGWSMEDTSQWVTDSPQPESAIGYSSALAVDPPPATLEEAVNVPIDFPDDFTLDLLEPVESVLETDPPTHTLNADFSTGSEAHHSLQGALQDAQVYQTYKAIESRALALHEGKSEDVALQEGLSVHATEDGIHFDTTEAANDNTYSASSASVWQEDTDIDITFDPETIDFDLSLDEPSEVNTTHSAWAASDDWDITHLDHKVGEPSPLSNVVHTDSSSDIMMDSATADPDIEAFSFDTAELVMDDLSFDDDTLQALTQEGMSTPQGVTQDWHWGAGSSSNTGDESTIPVIKSLDLNETDFKAGEVVRHKRYGTGTIKRVIVMEDNQIILNVTFDQGGKRLLDPRLTELEKVS